MAGPPKAKANVFFGLDVTFSREPSIVAAREATAKMFQSIQSIGSLAVKLGYFRGFTECKVSPQWIQDPDKLTALMRQLDCVGGETQIRRLVEHVVNEPHSMKIDAMVYIGDNCEDDVDLLMAKVGLVALRGVPILVFHEVRDDDSRARTAEPVFRQMAELTKGHYCQFNGNSAAVLKEVLENMIAFRMRGRAGLDALAKPTTPQGKQLAAKLMQLPPPR